ncbi:TetR/AcrR family transcriptional regulator [Mycobacterium antarcticum]|uniref:TetR/AcrR family transcriptional regulator n=1 Tax=unclassified Mycolicibacterium TaxID=2636767 RepID=UPI0024E08793|nr:MULTISPECIES: TetR/AcrR family transcriptional regulator [unclassified Mycolicibacterium]
MPRPALHSTDGLLDVAREMVLTDGARSVRIDRIVSASGAPKGSIYHRFPTVDDLLAAMWVRAVRRSQAEFLEALRGEEDPVQDAVAAGLAIFDFARRNRPDARLLASLRGEDLVATTADATMVTELNEINKPLKAGLGALACRLYGRATRTTVEWTTCAVVDLPMGAMRRHLIMGRPVPTSVRSQLESAIPAALRSVLTQTHIGGLS